MKNLKRSAIGLSFLIALLCAGCSEYTSEQLVKDAKYCTDNGFDYEIKKLADSDKPFAVYCKKKDGG